MENSYQILIWSAACSFYFFVAGWWVSRVPDASESRQIRVFLYFWSVLWPLGLLVRYAWRARGAIARRKGRREL